MIAMQGAPNSRQHESSFLAWTLSWSVTSSPQGAINHAVGFDYLLLVWTRLWLEGIYLFVPMVIVFGHSRTSKECHHDWYKFVNEKSWNSVFLLRAVRKNHNIHHSFGLRDLALATHFCAQPRKRAQRRTLHLDLPAQLGTLNFC